MSIQIDRSLFEDAIDTYTTKHQSKYKTQTTSLSSEVFDVAQDFFDAKPWVDADPSHYENKVETRCSMKLWIMDRIDLKDQKKAWFIPTFIWYWAASRLITYIIKKIVERYWPDLVAEMGEE